MGIIETIKKIEREESFERGIEKGMEKGIEKGRIEFVTNLLLADKFSITEIANFANVTEDFVRKVKEELKK